MELKDYLTNEKIRKKFTSQFDLVNYAIKLAANMIMTGWDSRVKIDSQNRAMQVMTEILHNKDHFDEIIISEEVTNGAESYRNRMDERHQNNFEKMDDSTSKPKERKKNRKILLD